MTLPSECVHGLSSPAICAHCQGQVKPESQKTAKKGSQAVIKLDSYLCYNTCIGCDPISNDRDNTDHWHRGSMHAAAVWDYFVHPIKM